MFNITVKYRFKFLVWLLLSVIGAVLWLITLGGNDSAHAWRGLLVNFAFFTPLAAGLAVWPAIVEASNGSWSGSIDKIAYTGLAFSIPSVLILILLWIGAPVWAPWYTEPVKQTFWLNGTFLFIRDLVSLIIFWAVAFYYIRNRNSKHSQMIAGYFAFTYAIVFSLLSFDLIMALTPDWSSTLFGGYFFISGLYTAVTAWAFLSVINTDIEIKRMHDLGKLILAFAVLTTYMVYSQLLPMWYENLPSETIALTPKLNFEPWYSISLFLVFVVYTGPVVLLLTQKVKKTKWMLLSVSSLLLAGLWIERYWLVNSLFQKSFDFGIADVGLILLNAGLLISGMIILYNTNFLKIREVD